MKKLILPKPTVLLALFLSLVLLQVVDFVSTYIGIRQGFVETNTLLVLIRSWVGLIPAILIGKIALSAIYYLFYRHAIKTNTLRSTAIGFALAVVLYLYVVISNFKLVGVL
jgi:hypothetical protein